MVKKSPCQQWIIWLHHECEWVVATGSNLLLCIKSWKKHRHFLKRVNLIKKIQVKCCFFSGLFNPDSFGLLCSFCSWFCNVTCCFFLCIWAYQVIRNARCIWKLTSGIRYLCLILTLMGSDFNSISTWHRCWNLTSKVNQMIGFRPLKCTRIDLWGRRKFTFKTPACLTNEILELIFRGILTLTYWQLV